MVKLSSAVPAGVAFNPSLPFYKLDAIEPIRVDSWEQICPPLPPKIFSISSMNIFGRKSSSSIDYSLMWTPEESPREVARRMIGECIAIRTAKSSDRNEIIHSADNDDVNERFGALFLEDNLVESLTYFRDFCQTHMVPETNASVDGVVNTCNDDNCDSTSCEASARRRPKLKCRIVATRGSTGAKCPLFHVDNVPCRWIQSMAGPGVDLVDTTPDSNDSGNTDNKEVIRWDAIPGMTTRKHSPQENNKNGSEDEPVSWSLEDRNSERVDLEKANVYHSKPGEAILIPGKSWDKFSLSSSQVATKPIVHKSPQILQSDQCRVLFTQDIVYE